VHHVVSAHGGRKFGVSYISYMMMKFLVCHIVSLYLLDSRLDTSWCQSLHCNGGNVLCPVEIGLCLYSHLTHSLDT